MYRRHICLFSTYLFKARLNNRHTPQTRQKMILFEPNARHTSRKDGQQLTSTMPGETCVLKYAKLTEKAFDPSKGSDYAAGYDLRSAYNYTVKSHGKELILTDLQIQVPNGCYGRIAPRSGLAWKNFIDIGAGVIDIDYRGNVGVVIFNHGECDFVINAGDRIAQLICEKIAYPSLEEVQTLDKTERGIGGFGSTGTN